jgi:hypothetical protein
MAAHKSDANDRKTPQFTQRQDQYLHLIEFGSILLGPMKP